MKKLLLTFSVLLTAFIFCSCSGNDIFCRHEYSENITESTCCTEGQNIKTCIKCGRVKKIVIEKKNHSFSDWNVITQQSCTEDGTEKRICIFCNFEETRTLEKTGHIFGNYVTVIEATDIQNGLEERRCLRCPEVEKRIVQSINYVDTSLFLMDYDSTENYSITNEKELAKITEAAVFNRTVSQVFTLNFEFDSLNGLVDRLVDNFNLDISFSVNATLAGQKLTLKFTYPPEPAKSTSAIPAYTQLSSANYDPIIPDRPADFDGFKINSSAVSYEVSTSEQLFYALECRVKPLPVPSSSAERIYKKMKTVLRQIISDDMNDFQKARAIYDWIIMNVTYDGYLYDMMENGTIEYSNEYKSFFLEGVFDDGIAVCDGISKAYSALANIEGIPCVQVSGKQTANPSGVGHAWNKIYINGNWYIVDATSGGTILNRTNEILSLEFFLITDNIISKYYTASEYIVLDCQTEYDSYSEQKIFSSGQEYDFYVGSQTELNAVIKYFSEFAEKNKSVQFKISPDFDIGESPDDEILISCTLASIDLYGKALSGENYDIVTLWQL